jgi:hypothetical protein
VNANGTSAEMISIKGASVHFRYNTIRKHDGDIDIRAGKKNSIYGNYILVPARASACTRTTTASTTTTWWAA